MITVEPLTVQSERVMFEPESFSDLAVKNLAFSLAESNGFSNLSDFAYNSGNGIDYTISSIGEPLFNAWIDTAEAVIEANGAIELSLGALVVAVPVLIHRDAPIRGSVYVITDGRLVKIGATTDMQMRMNDIQVSNPDIAILDIIDCSDIYGVEESLHFYFRAQRVRGEWFDLLNDMGMTYIEYLSWCGTSKKGITFEHRYRIQTDKQSYQVFDTERGVA